MTRDEELYVRQQAGEPNQHVRVHDDQPRLRRIEREQRAAMARIRRLAA